MRSLPASEASFWSTFCNGARTDRDTHPINCVDWSQAQALCQSRGGRLPTEAEWEFTARGADGRRAPWGGTPPAANLLNACGAECPSIGERPNRARWPVMFDRTDGYDTTAPVGSYLQGASPFGVQDLIGNVLEWTGDWFGPYTATPSPVANPTGPATGTQRVARGGVHWQSSNAQQARSAVRLPGDPTWRLATLGFRCAASPGSTPPAPAAPAAPSAPPAPAPAAVPTGC
jgi:formylglycine-generating enzyme required for sulfatase activity